MDDLHLLHPGLFTESPKTPAADLECGGRKEKCGSGCAGGEQELALEKYRHSAGRGTRGVSRFWSGLTKYCFHQYYPINRTSRLLQVPRRESIGRP